MMCPVCAYPSLPYPPTDYHICPCCGTEFGNDDQDRTHHELREDWIACGAPWFFGKQPAYWNPWFQLIEGHYESDLPYHAVIEVWNKETAYSIVYVNAGREFME